MRIWLNRLSWTITGLAVLILLLKLANWSAQHGHSLPPLPQPNGYDALVAAAGKIRPPPLDLTELTPAQLQPVADQNRPAIEQARDALQMECRVALKPIKDWDDHHDEELTQLKRLAVAFGIEARFQRLNQHTNEAIRCDLDLLHLAEASRNGGIIVDGITGLTIETIGVMVLQIDLPHLDAANCRKAASELETFNDLREPPATMFATQKAWSARRFGLVNWIGGFLARKSLAARQTKFLQRSREVAGHTQHLMIRYAVRAYELENQKPPATMSVLVPDYLKAMPRDLATGEEIQEIPQLPQ